MPSLRDQVDADFADFSFALLCVGLGSVLAMPWSGRLTDRLSSGVTVRVFGAVAAGALALSGFLPNLVALALCFLAAGVGIGVWDVSMNVQGHAVETRQGRVLMPGWHAAYSFGSVGGALFGAGSASRDPVGVQLAVTSAAAYAVVLASTRKFVDDSLAGDAGFARPSALRRPATRLPATPMPMTRRVRHRRPHAAGSRASSCSSA